MKNRGQGKSSNPVYYFLQHSWPITVQNGCGCWIVSFRKLQFLGHSSAKSDPGDVFLFLERIPYLPRSFDEPGGLTLSQHSAANILQITELITFCKFIPQTNKHTNSSYSEENAAVVPAITLIACRWRTLTSASSFRASRCHRLDWNCHFVSLLLWQILMSLTGLGIECFA